MEDLKQIVDRLLALPPRDRLDIARRLLESIDNGESEAREGLSESELETIRRKLQDVLQSAEDEEDPLERFWGSLEIGGGWAERHDEYIGDALFQRKCIPKKT